MKRPYRDALLLQDFNPTVASIVVRDLNSMAGGNEGLNTTSSRSTVLTPSSPRFENNVFRKHDCTPSNPESSLLPAMRSPAGAPRSRRMPEGDRGRQVPRERR